MAIEEETNMSKFDQTILELFMEFMARVSEFDELVALGSRLLSGFQQGLESLRRPPIEKSSELLKNIMNANKTTMVQSYLDAGCIKTRDSVQNISKCQAILKQLESLLDEVTDTMRGAFENLPPISDSLEGGTIMEEEGFRHLLQLLSQWPSEITCIVLSCSQRRKKREFITLGRVGSSFTVKREASDFALLMAVVYRMVKQDFSMQERIISDLNLKTGSGELENYCLMWSLRHFINDGTMLQVWKLVP